MLAGDKHRLEPPLGQRCGQGSLPRVIDAIADELEATGERDDSRYR